MTRRAKATVMRTPKHRCHTECQGWELAESNGVFEIQRCEHCWEEDPNPLFDEDYRANPECQKKLLEKELRAASEPWRANRPKGPCGVECTGCAWCLS